MATIGLGKRRYSSLFQTVDGGVMDGQHGIPGAVGHAAPLGGNQRAIDLGGAGPMVGVIVIAG